MAQTDKPWYKKWWAIALFIVIGLAIIGSLLPDSNNSNSSNTNTQNSNSQNQVAQNFNLGVTSQIVKKVDGKCRYFFDIRNNDNKNFEGSVKISLINENGDNVWYDTFTTNQPIEPTLGTSVYTDANTCPVAIHGSYGIATYEYEAKMNNQVVKTGTGTISDSFEDLS